MKPDKISIVRVSVSGFNKTQVEKGLSDLVDELMHRPWLITPKAFWDDSTNKLVIIVGDETGTRVEDGIFDEISDCIIARMNFDRKIKFDIQRN